MLFLFFFHLLIPTGLTNAVQVLFKGRFNYYLHFPEIPPTGIYHNSQCLLSLSSSWIPVQRLVVPLLSLLLFVTTWTCSSVFPFLIPYLTYSQLQEDWTFLITNCLNWQICVEYKHSPHQTPPSTTTATHFNFKESPGSQQRLLPLPPLNNSHANIYLFIYIPSLCWGWIWPELPPARPTAAVIHGCQLPRGH